MVLLGKVMVPWKVLYSKKSQMGRNLAGLVASSGPVAGFRQAGGCIEGSLGLEN